MKRQKKQLVKLFIFITVGIAGLLIGLNRSYIRSVWAVSPTPNDESPSDIAEDAELDNIDGDAGEENPNLYEESSPKVKYKGTWQKKQKVVINGSKVVYARSQTEGDKSWLRFKNANRVEVVLLKSPEGGKARVRVVKLGSKKVGVFTKNVDLKGNIFDLYYVVVPNLPAGSKYRVVVRVKDANRAIGQECVGLDSFKVTGVTPTKTPTPIPTLTSIPTSTLTPTPSEDPEDDGIPDGEEEADETELDIEDADVPFSEAEAGSTVEIEENDTRVKYKGTWTGGSDGNTIYKQANVKKNNARIKFKAKSVKVILRKSPDAGRVRVVVRNLTTKTNTRKRLNLYSSSVSYTTDELFFDNLDTNAVYRVRVYVIGKHAAASTGNFVGLDKFIFTGTTPPDDDEDGDWLTKYDVPIGTKQSLTINIGGGDDEPTVGPNTPQVKFTAKLFGTETNPEIKVRLKVTDLIAVVTPAPVADDFNACQNPKVGEFFVDGLTLTADSNGGYYSPKAGSAYSIRRGDGDDITGTVSSDGWVALHGVAKGKRYSLILKGPKHVALLMEENVALVEGKPNAQNFAWISKPLPPGDVPDPSEDNLQNCVVNAADVSLVKNRTSDQDPTAEDLMVADLNYDDIVNAIDVGLLTNTLSTRGDDD